MAGLPISRTCSALPRSSASIVCLRIQTYFPRRSSNVQLTTALPASVLAVLVVASVCKEKVPKGWGSTQPSVRRSPGSSRLRQRQTASESSFRSSCQQWVRSALLPLRHVGRLLCLEYTIRLEFLYLRGQGLERLYHLRLRSPRPLIPLYLPLQHTTRVLPSSVSSSRLRCGQFSQCLLKRHGSPWVARVWVGFRSSLVSAVLVEKTRKSHRLKSEEVRNVVRRRSVRGGSRRGLERP